MDQLLEAARSSGLSEDFRTAQYLEDPEIAFLLYGSSTIKPHELDRSDTELDGCHRQKLPFSGKLGLKEQITQQDARIAEQELHAGERRERLSLWSRWHTPIFSWRKRPSRYCASSKQLLEIMRTIIRATETGCQVGRVTQQDVFKALLEQSEIMNQLINVEEESSAAQAKLNTAMYRPPRSAVQLPGDLAAPERGSEPHELDHRALTNHPPLKGAPEEIGRSERMQLARGLES